MLDYENPFKKRPLQSAGMLGNKSLLGQVKSNQVDNTNVGLKSSNAIQGRNNEVIRVATTTTEDVSTKAIIPAEVGMKKRPNLHTNNHSKV